jgi:hypothetical protein
LFVEETMHDSRSDVEDMVVLRIDLVIYFAILLDHQVLEIFYLVVLLRVRVNVLRSVDFDQ